jgi:16S rRNA processing protein RimM
MPVQDLIVVEAADGKEILIPFVQEIVPEVNVGEKYILVTPPPGLFEINIEDAGAEGSEEEGAEPQAAAGDDA